MVLVSDSSVLIDLDRGGLLEEAFSFGVPMLVPDLIFENELRSTNGNYLRELGLTVIALTPDEVAFAQEVTIARPGLSTEDCFALSCARRDNHTLLAGDGLLRKEAMARKIECHGLLWLLDEMLASTRVSNTTLCEGITRIAQH